MWLRCHKSLPLSPLLVLLFNLQTTALFLYDKGVFQGKGWCLPGEAGLLPGVTVTNQAACVGPEKGRKQAATFDFLEYHATPV